MSDVGRRICIACPSLDAAHNGNRTTASRWFDIFRALGHTPKIVDATSNADGDLVVALHARKSSQLIQRSKQACPQRPVVLALTGTDLYANLDEPETSQSLELADRIVVLQPMAKERLPTELHNKTRTIYQSIDPINVPRPQSPTQLRVIVAGHLRDVKDPMRAEQAVRNLPTDSAIHVAHFGAVLHEKYQALVDDASRENPRYSYCGQVSHAELRTELATCWLMVISSTLEGGANVVSEAIVQGTPVLASRIDGSIGLLGESYEGYFDVGDTAQLRELLLRCESEPTFYRQLQAQVAARSDRFAPARELAAWQQLIGDVMTA